MKLQPGCYLIMKDGGHFHSSYHYMRVFYEGKVKFIQMDHLPKQQISHDDEQFLVQDFVLLETVTRNTPVKYEKPQIIIKWYDGKGHNFQHKMSNIDVLRILFNRFPGLAKALGVRKKKVQK